VYGACIGSTAVAQLIVPGRTPCLRCLHRELPEPGAAQTCDMAGIIGPTAALAAALQVGIALRFVVEGSPADAALVCADVWDARLDRIALPPRDPAACPSCGLGRFDFLEASTPAATRLCGRDAVQVRALSARAPDLATLGQRLRALGTVHVNEYLLRLRVPPYELTLFDDGRAIVKGTADEALARTLVSRWIGV
jgi:adenylyltransferase/sulfurtransferase